MKNWRVQATACWVGASSCARAKKKLRKVSNLRTSVPLARAFQLGQQKQTIFSKKQERSRVYISRDIGGGVRSLYVSIMSLLKYQFCCFLLIMKLLRQPAILMADEQILGEEDFNAAQALDLILDSKKDSFIIYN